MKREIFTSGFFFLSLFVDKKKNASASGFSDLNYYVLVLTEWKPWLGRDGAGLADLLEAVYLPGNTVP